VHSLDGVTELNSNLVQSAKEKFGVSRSVVFEYFQDLGSFVLSMIADMANETLEVVNASFAQGIANLVEQSTEIVAEPNSSNEASNCVPSFFLLNGKNAWSLLCRPSVHASFTVA
jgi:predicted Zn-dependent peptidase